MDLMPIDVLRNYFSKFVLPFQIIGKSWQKKKKIRKYWYLLNSDRNNRKNLKFSFKIVIQESSLIIRTVI